MTTEKSYQIQEFRARLLPEQLEKERVWYLIFPYHQSLNTFLRQMERIRGKSLLPRHMPPWRWLNKFLVALIPSLVHPFIKGLSKIKGERHLLVLDGYPRPSVDQITLLVRIWLRRWVESCFKRELQTLEGQDAYQQLLTGLASPATDWQSIDAGFLIREKNHPLIYTALPSLLAARLKGTQMLINDEPIEWQLAQEGNNRLALVSQPILSHHVHDYNDKVIEGHFVYRVDFAVHTVPDDPDPRPFVHIQIASRRYVEKGPIRKFLYKRSSTVMVGVRKPRITTGDWPVVPTLVPIRIRGIKTLRFWDDRIVELLDDLKKIFTPDQVRSLIDPSILAEDPDAYWYSENEEDTYFILFAEGIRPDHALGSSFSPREFYQVWRAIMDRSRDVLEADVPLERDKDTAKPGKTVSMLSFWEMNEQKYDKKTKRPIKTAVKTPFNERRKQRLLDESAKRILGIEAFQRVFSGEQVVVLLLYITEEMRDEVMKQLQNCSFKDCPNLVIKYKRIDDALVTLLNPGDIDPEDLELPDLDEEMWEQKHNTLEDNLILAKRQRKAAWKKLLTPLRPKQGAVFALIEIPQDSWEREELNPKGVIREVCIELRIGSQLLASFKKNEKAGASRVKNAVADLLVRQTGLLHGDICEIYAWAGMSPAIAEKLTVVGLYRHRSTKYMLDYVLAVRILPSGLIEMLLPGASQWQPYRTECFTLGSTFAQVSKKESLKLKQKVMERFVEHICLSTDGPTLLLLEATDFRTVWTQMQNPDMRLNELLFSTHPEAYKSKNVPDTWMVRLRESGALIETPQYVRLGEDDQEEETIAFADGLFDVGPSGKFSVYHSIGRGPTYKKQNEIRDYWKSSEGGEESFKHPHAVEIVPFFLQTGIEAVVLARVAHFLRNIPSWDSGNTILPLPNHLAADAIKDYLCLLPRADEGEV
jgi:hypothetical protein